MLLTNFVFIILFLSFNFSCFGLLWLPTVGVISGRSLLYSVEFGVPLRGKLYGPLCCRGSRVGCESESYPRVQAARLPLQTLSRR